MNKIAIMGIFLLFSAAPAFAGDAATIIFDSGQVVTIQDGFREIVSEMKKLNNDSSKHRIVELEIGGGAFLLNMSAVVVVCRDRCKGLTIRHQLDPQRVRAK